MNKQQVDSLIRSSLKIVGGLLAAHGYAKYASMVNCEDMAAILMALVGIFLSWQHHAIPSQAQLSDLRDLVMQFGQGREPDALDRINAELDQSIKSEGGGANAIPARGTEPSAAPANPAPPAPAPKVTLVTIGDEPGKGAQ
jgi:hypothetical protein